MICYHLNKRSFTTSNVVASNAYVVSQALRKINFPEEIRVTPYIIRLANHITNEIFICICLNNLMEGNQTVALALKSY